MVQKSYDNVNSVALLRKLHLWILVSEKLFKSIKFQIKYSELYKNIKYNEIMKMFPPVVSALKRFQNNEDYLTKLITINSNVENFVKKTIQKINYNPIDEKFMVFFTTSVANSILLTVKIVMYNAFYKTEYDSYCSKIDALYNATNDMTDKIEYAYLIRCGISETNKIFNNDVRVPIDKCVSNIENMFAKMDMNLNAPKLVSPYVHQYTYNELVEILKERLHIDEHTKLDPDYKLTTTCCLVTKAV